jgi:hypothetical protein
VLFHYLGEQGGAVEIVVFAIGQDDIRRVLPINTSR